MPKQILYKPWISSRFIRIALSKVIYGFEQFSCLFFDGIISVTDDIARKYKASKNIVLRNLPIISIAKNLEPDLNKSAQKKVIFVYAGGLTKVRGIKEICQAMKPNQNNAELWLLGPWEDELYQNECLTSENKEYVKYLGFMSMPEVYQHIQMADVGIAMLYPIKNYITSLPVKAFEYMVLSKPLLMSNFDYWKEVFQGCAVFADANSVDEISSQIKLFIENENLRNDLGKKGYDMVQNELNWEKEAEKLFSLYNRILG